MSKNPFPGPQPYRASDRALFYGRDDLSYKLEGSVLANRCVTVYGPSGAGKSSIVQASVIPSLIESQEIRVVRVDGWPEDREPTAWLAATAYSNLGFGEPPTDTPAADALLAAAQRAARRSPRIVLVYLDQIEQLLYASRDAAEGEAFFNDINRLVEAPLRNLRVVLSLREDYLGRFRDRLKDHRRILDHGFRVGPLTVADLTSAVCQAAAAGEPPQEWDAEAMRELMLQVRVPGQAASDDAEAQSAYAQIVCRALFQERAGGEGSTSAAADEAEPILRRYLEATLDDLGPLRASAQRLLEDHLVSADGSRTLRTEKELLRIVPADELSPILKALEGAAILHAEQRQGSRYFEIGHDWLARRVFEQRQDRERAEEERRREEEREREREQQRAENAARITKARRERRFYLGITAGALALAGIFGGVGFWAWQQKLAADRAGRAERAAREQADEKKKLADSARIVSAFLELSARGKLAWALKLLPEVNSPEVRRRSIAFASDALNSNALRASLAGHKGPLSAAAWSPDGAMVVTASADKTARIFRADGTGDPLVLRGHDGPVISASWSPDGKSVVTASEDGNARVFQADGAAPPVLLKGHEGAVIAVAWSPDGKRVLTASLDGTARVFSADGAGQPIVLSGHTGALTAALWTPDGARVVTASSDGTAMLFNADGAGKPVVLKGHTADVLALAISKDGTKIATGSRDKTVRVWDATGKGRPVALSGNEGSVYQVAFSQDGLRVASASADRTARVFSVDGKGEPVVLRGHELSVSFVSWSLDGKYVATASADKTARIWPSDGAGIPLVLAGHEAPIRSVTWSPDGKRVLTAASDRGGGSTDNTAKVWSVEPLASLPRESRGGGFFHAASTAAACDRVAAAYDDNSARLFLTDGSSEPVVFKGHEGWVASASLSPDGSRVATAAFDNTSRVFQADGKGAPVVLKGHEAAVRSASWSLDGSRIVTASDDLTARVFMADGSGAPVVLKGHTDWLSSAIFSPDGARVVTTSLDQTARIFKADGSGEPVVLAEHKGGVNAAAFCPDGQRVITASEDRTARIFKVEGGPSIRVLRGHGGAVLRVICSPDGKRVATSSADKTIRIWSLEQPLPPAVIDVSSPAIALSFLDDGQKLFGVLEDNTTHTWLIDGKVLTARLLSAHSDCVPPDVRRISLGESARDAQAKYDECERSYHRTPPERPKEGVK